MRLFIAASFSKEVIDNLLESRNELKKISTSLSLSNPNNYHLTLAFLGECEINDIERIKEIIDNCFDSKERIVINGYGFFNRESGKIVFREVNVSSNFVNQILNMKKSLLDNHLPCDNSNTFTPHITLSRNTCLKSGCKISELPYKEIEFIVDKITLFESVLDNIGPNTYCSLYSKILK